MIQTAHLYCNKKSRMLYLVIALCFSSVLPAQEMLEAVDVAVGYEPDGYLIRAGYSRVYGKHLITMAGQAHFENHRIGAFNEEVQARQYLVNAEYHYEFWDHNERDFVLAGGGGGIAGYETIDNITLNDGGIIASESDVVYGGFLSINAEKYLIPIRRRNALALLLNVRYNYFFQSQLGAQQFNATIGARYIF